MPRPPFDPDAPHDNYDDKDQSFFERFKDRVTHHASKRGAADATWEDVWLTLLDNWETAKILEDKGISTRGLKRDVSYALHFGRPVANEAASTDLTSKEADSLRRDTVQELVDRVNHYAEHSETFASSHHYRNAAYDVASHLEQMLQQESEGTDDRQKLRVSLFDYYAQRFIKQVYDNTRDNDDVRDAAETLKEFAAFIQSHDVKITTGPIAALEAASSEYGDPTPHQLVETAIRMADPYITYNLYRNGMVAPDHYEPPAKAHPDAIQNSALQAFEYADKLREKDVETRHLLAVLLEDWNVIKHLKKVEELELLAQKEAAKSEDAPKPAKEAVKEEDKDKKDGEKEKPTSIFADYRDFFAKVREVIEPKKEDGERFRKVRVVGGDLKQFIQDVEPVVSKGPEELATSRLFGEMIKRPEVREMLKAGGITDAMLDRWPEALAKTNEKIEKEEKKKPESKFKIDDEQLEYLLERFARDVTKEAMLGKLDPVIGRESETDQMVQIALQRNRSNGILLGEAGVGKTALFGALAQKIASGQVPEKLIGSKVYELDIQKMNEGAMYVGMFEARLKPILEGLAERNKAGETPPSIICMDEIADNTKVGGISTAKDILKPLLSKGGLIAFSATTEDEYKKMRKEDKAFDRRWQPIMVDAPNAEHAVEILDQSQRVQMERHYKMTVPEVLLPDIVRLTTRYIADKQQPDISITTLDQACSRAKMKGKTELELEDVIDVVAKAAHLDPDFIKHGSDRLLDLDVRMKERVYGQDGPVDEISDSLIKANAGLNDPDKPMGAFLALGPTGVGKTETARALAEILHGSKRAMVRIDMGKYQEKHSLSGLIGAPPGYVGYEEGGELTEKVRKRPYSVVVLDEIEKAHPDVFKTLLSILEEGEITDGENRRVDFRNTIIIMTSNLKDPSKHFPPEFMNRLTAVLNYQHLPKEEIHRMVDREVGMVSNRMETQWGLKIDLGDKAREQLAERGYQPEYGARALKRVVDKAVAVPLSRWLMKSRASLPKTGLVGVDDIEQFKPELKPLDEKVIPFPTPEEPQTHAEKVRASGSGRDPFTWIPG